MVVSGDGDLTSIGGNHLIHAARRGIDLTVICANTPTPFLPEKTRCKHGARG